MPDDLTASGFDQLLAAVARAEAQGTIDDVEARCVVAKAFGHAVIDLMSNDPRFAAMTCPDAVRTIAGLIGLMVRDNRTAGPLSGAIIAAELAQIILEIATEE